MTRSAAAATALRPVRRRDDHPLRRRLRLDRGGVARGGRVGRRPKAVGNQRAGDLAALAGHRATPWCTAAAFPSAAPQPDPRRPLGRMPRLAPEARFPSATPSATGAARPARHGEIGGEIERQLDASRRAWASRPTTSTGTSMCTCCPGCAGRCWTWWRGAIPRPPLIRDPSDRSRDPRAARRRPRRWRSQRWRWASRGAAHARTADERGLLRLLGFDVREPYASELARALTEPGPRHIVMCHPGHADGELGLDPVVDRRRMEYDALMRNAA